MARSFLSLKYIAGAFLAIPLAPWLYLQGKRLKQNMPKLPEATGHEGQTGASGRALRLLVFGESTMAGVGVDTHENGFAGHLARYLSEKMDTAVIWRVVAKSGPTAKRAREQLLPLVEAAPTDLVVIGLGANDAFELSRPGHWGRQVDALIGALRDRLGDVPIVFLSVPPIKAFPAFSGAIRFVIGNLSGLLDKEMAFRVSRHHHVWYAAGGLAIADWQAKYQGGDFFSDGVHPSGLAYQIWAEATGAFMLENEELAKELERKMSADS